MNETYASVQEKAAQWGLTPRQVQYLCSRGKLPGARRFGRSWAIPASAEKPADGRRRETPEQTTLPGGVPVYEAGEIDVAVIGGGPAGVEAVKDLLPEEVLWRKKSPYPKTHNPAFAKAAAERLRAILAEDTPLTELVRRERLEWLLGTDESIAWYGQLMNVPQMMAFFVQLDYWLKRYNIRIV